MPTRNINNDLKVNANLYLNMDTNSLSGDSNGAVVLAGYDSLTLKTQSSPRVTINSSGNVGIGTTGPASKLHVDGTVQVGVNDTGYDVKFYGDDSGEYMEWDASNARLNIIHTDEIAGLQLFTNAAAQTTQPQIKIGRSNNQYWGAYVDDRNAHLVHRQDETSGNMTTRFDQWDSNTSDNNGFWAWRVGNGSGGSMATAMSLTQGGNLTIEGNSRLYGGATDYTYLQIANSDYNYRFYTRTNVGASLERFTIEGGAVDGKAYFQNTKVGIGTTSPDKLLDVSSASNPTIRISSSKSGSFSADEVMSSIEFYSADTSGVGAGVRSSIRSLAHDQYGSRTELSFSTTDSSADSEKMRIDTDGNVGIGTTNPSRKFEVHEGNVYLKVGAQSGYTDGYGPILTTNSNAIVAPEIVYLAASQAYIRRENIGGQGLTLHGDTFSRFTYYNGSGIVEALRIDNAGNVGIGTTGPTSPLTIKSNSFSSADSGFTLQANSNTNAIVKIAERATDGARLHMYDGGVEKIAFYTDGTANHISAGNVGIGDTTPSYKLDVNGTLRATSAAYFNNDVVVTNNLTLTGANKPTFTTPDDTVYTPSHNWVTATPFNAAWHDLIAFDRNYTTSQEISTDGSTFSSDTLELGLFDQKDKANYTVIGSGERAVRWTWTGVAYNVARYFHIAATYSNPTPSCTVKIETSSDGSTWTEIHSSSGISFSATNRFYHVDPYVGNGGHNYVRLTIDKGNTDTKIVRLSGIKMLTQRLGDQGKGREDELPFYYDKNQNIGIGTASPAYKLQIHNGNAAITGGSSSYLYLNTNTNYLYGDQNGVTILEGYDNLRFQTQGSERMRINSSGNITLGTASVAAANGAADDFHIKSTGDSGITISSGNSSTGTIFFGDVASSTIAGFRYNHNTGDMAISAEDNVTFACDNVGIGTTSPSKKLDVDGEAIIDSTLFVRADGGSNYTASRIELNSHNGYRGAGLYLNGVNRTWYAGSPYTDFAGKFIIAKTDSSSDRGAAQPSNALFTILSGGNVGIGTTSPAGKLQVYTSANRHTTILGSTADLEVVSDNNTNPVALIKGTGTADLLNVFDNTTEVFTILDGGNVGIGTTNPSHLLHVYAADGVAVDSYISLVQNAEATAGDNFGLKVQAGRNSSDVTMEVSNAVGTSYMRVRGDGNVGIGTVSPSTKLDVTSGAVNDARIRVKTGDSNAGAYFQARSGTDGFYGLELYHQSTAKWFIGGYGVNRLGFFAGSKTTAANEKMSLTTAGNVGIGTTSPFKKLDLGATSSETDIALNYSDVGTNLGQIGFALGSNKLISGDTEGDLVLRNSVSGKSIIFGTQSTERVRIDSSGNVGIGETAPEVKLEVAGDIMAKDSFVSAGATASQGYTFHDFGTGWGYKGVQSPSRLAMFTASAERVTIDSNGNVGIGTTNPAQKLHVNGNVDIDNGGILLQQAYGINFGVSGYDIVMPTTTRLGIKTAGTERITILNTGNVGIGTTSPSQKLHVEGNIELVSGFQIGSNSGSYWQRIRTEDAVASTTNAFNFETRNGSGSFIKHVVIRNDGNVGVGNATPATKLAVEGTIAHKVYTVSTLPSASPAGQRAFVSDGYYTLQQSHGSGVYGGGSNFCPVYSDGSNWFNG